MTPPAQSEVAAAPVENDPEEVLKLVCPECQGTLNLRRKHIGLAGKCVHCELPVTAVETAEGEVKLVETAKLKAAEDQPKEVKETVPAEPAPVDEAPESEEVAPSLRRGEIEPVPASAEVEPEPAPVEAAPATEPEAKPEKSEEPEQVAEEKVAAADEEPAKAKESPLFDSPSESAAPSALFGESVVEVGDLNECWGANPPKETHASISPFATGSANQQEQPGFAQSLFGQSPAGGSGSPEGKSPFGEISKPESGSPLIAAPEKASEEAEEEVVLDGDGRPMKPMTDEQKEQFGKDMMKFGGYHQRSPWRKRIIKFVATVTILCGLGYAGYIYMPDSMAEKAKDKVIAWLEPGSVLADFLPFEVGVDPETGEEGQIRIKAIDGFNELSGEFDAYMKQADENLNSTAGEGKVVMPERGEAEQMEGPAIPKLPFKLPMNLPGMASSSESAEGDSE